MSLLLFISGLAPPPVVVGGEPDAPLSEPAEAFTTVLERLVKLQLHGGTARAATDATISLADGASPLDSFYVGAAIVITSEPWATARPSRRITSYTGASRVATVDRAWDIVPDATSRYLVIG